MGDRERSGELTSWCCRAELRECALRPHTEGPRQEGEVPPLFYPLSLKSRQSQDGGSRYPPDTMWSKGPHGQQSPNRAPPTRPGRVLLVGARSNSGEEHCFP